ncbi:MAG TPA: GspE/PulE family protein [Polyangia bacterium]|nr:GspE/PulE family protein [Polyangia bacterium]
MIRNPAFLYLAIAAAAGGAFSRHAQAVDGWLGRELLGGLPAPVFFIGAAVVFVALSLAPFGRSRRGPAPVDARRLFVKDDPQAIAARLAALTAGERVDIPLVVDYAIFQAIAADASDIHFEPRREGYTLRYRVQGMMTDIAALPAAVSAPLVNRLKVLSNLIIYRGALPQDGRIHETAGDTRTSDLERSGLAGADFRIALMPTLHGERIVIRILGRGGDHLDLAELGMTDLDRRLLTRLLEKPQGMVILTGPTGSGKTTTIYSCLREVRIAAGARRSLATLEDPIEIDLEGVSQSQVDEERGYTFDKGLRAILRQDPDVIMVGEIRDPETARIAIQAGMTGHLIITTVHANSTSAAFSRLLELGLAAYSINAAVTAVLSQRLVRRICPHCRRERGFAGNDLEELGLTVQPPDLKLFHGLGCEACSGTGYLGRTALFEVLEVTEEIRGLVSGGASAGEISRAAREGGNRGLHAAAIEAVSCGVTTPEEIARVISREDH